MSGAALDESACDGAASPSAAPASRDRDAPRRPSDSRIDPARTPMDDYCQDLRRHVSEVLTEWEQLVREQPWYSLPPQHRIDNLPDVVIGQLY